jgi:hypothetical protein
VTTPQLELPRLRMKRAVLARYSYWLSPTVVPLSEWRYPTEGNPIHIPEPDLRDRISSQRDKQMRMIASCPLPFTSPIR